MIGHTIEKREYIDGIGWIYWKPVYVFNLDNSKNPRLEALLAFEKIKSSPRVIYRVVDQFGKLVIEQR